MPLRVRLSIAFVAIVLVPLTVTAFLVRNNVKSNFDASANATLNSVETSTDLALQGLIRTADEAAGALAEKAGPKGKKVGDALRTKPQDLALVRGVIKTSIDRSKAAPASRRPDFFIVSGPDGTLIEGSIARTPSYQSGVRVPSLAGIAKGVRSDDRRSIDGVVVRRFATLVDSASPQDTLGYVIAGYWLDRTFLEQIQGRSNLHLTLAAGGRASASTLEDAELAQAFAEDASDGADFEGYRHGKNQLGDTATDLIASVSLGAQNQATGRTTQSIAAVIVISLLMAGLFGWLLARVTTRPLAELGEAANSVASGRLDTRIEVRSRDEVGKLAIAFNTMTDELRTYIQALQDSRDELKRNLTRLGDTLSSTHDLKKMLAVILETAMVTIRAEAGALMLFSANRDELYLKVGRGLDGRLTSSSVRVPIGEGVAGHVAELGEGVRGTVGTAGDQLELAAHEPRADSVISVPLKSQGRVIGVLNLYDRVDADEFDDNDLATIRSFANQATVAIDNVLLHQEAQRLSITDGLTGLWNYRYFQMQFDKEIERASRFNRPLALLVLDLDRFKSVNDQYGHQRGDSVLIELATRVKGAIRDVDILARYGGEEFVLILPETDLEGAIQAAGKICELVRHRRFGSASETPLRVTVSIGVAVYPDHGKVGTSLLKTADAALYAAKEAGRDGYWIATAPTAGDADDVEAAPRDSRSIDMSPVQNIDEISADEVSDLGGSALPAPVEPAPEVASADAAADTSTAELEAAPEPDDAEDADATVSAVTDAEGTDVAVAEVDGADAEGADAEINNGADVDGAVVDGAVTDVAVEADVDDAATDDEDGDDDTDPTPVPVGVGAVSAPAIRKHYPERNAARRKRTNRSAARRRRG